MRRLLNWLRVSISDPANIPHYLTAVFTLALAVFACFAWVESQRTTHALQGQLTALKAEQRPFISLVETGNPRFNTATGEILVNWFTRNYGRGIAYNVVEREFMKIDSPEYFAQPPYKGPPQTFSGDEEPPGKINFGTAISRPGYSQEYFSSLLKKNQAIGIAIEFYYSDTYGEQRYSNVVCEERLNTGAWTYINPKDCHRQ
jgi:hypothetical protein